MKVLITGGSGFIGSMVASQLVGQGHDVSIFDVIDPPNGLDVEFTKGDTFDPAQLGRCMEGRDTVVHMVGLADARLAQQNPVLSFDLNVRSAFVVLEEARKQKVGKVLIPSSASVYGATPVVPIPETTAPNPSSVYSYHKHIMERTARCWAENYGMNVAILRLFNVYGAKGKGILNILVENAIRHEVTTLYGSDQIRDFVHVTDVANAFTGLVGKSDLSGYQVYNVGSGSGRSINDIVEVVKEFFPDLRIDQGQFSGVPYDSVADLTAIRHDIGYVPQDVETVMRSTIREIMGKVMIYA